MQDLYRSMQHAQHVFACTLLVQWQSHVGSTEICRLSTLIALMLDVRIPSCHETHQCRHATMRLRCREFNLSGAHPKTSKQAALERHEQQQQQQEDNLRPHGCSSGRGRSQSVGKQRGSGEQRLEQLARPKTAHWDKCECMCVLQNLLHRVVCMESSLQLSQSVDRYNACASEHCRKDISTCRNCESAGWVPALPAGGPKSHCPFVNKYSVIVVKIPCATLCSGFAKTAVLKTNGGWAFAECALEWRVLSFRCAEKA